MISTARLTKAESTSPKQFEAAGFTRVLFKVERFHNSRKKHHTVQASSFF